MNTLPWRRRRFGFGIPGSPAKKWLQNAKLTKYSWIGEIKSNRIVFYEEKDTA